MGFRAAFQYAWHGSGRRWDAAPIGIIGGLLGGLVFWQLGLKVPQTILDNPLWGGVVAIVLGAVIGVVVVFVARLCWWPFHRRLEPHGGLHFFLRSKLGDFMWPVVLIASGLLAFVLLTGAGVIWLSLQVLAGPSVAQVSSTPNTVGHPDFVLLPPEHRYKFKWDPSKNPRIDVRSDANRNPDITENPAFILRNKTNTVAYNIAITWQSETATNIEELIKSPILSKFTFTLDGTRTKFTLDPAPGARALSFSYYLDEAPKQTVAVVAKEAELYFPSQLLPVTALYLITKMPPKLGDTSDPFILRVSINWETSEGKRRREYRLHVSATNAKASDAEMPIAEGFLNFSLEEIKQ